MKIIYCIAGLYNSAGMERIITEKANYLVEEGHNVVILTAEQRGREIFYPLHPKVIHEDLGINYSENRSIIKKAILYPWKKYKHKKKLAKYLYENRPDIVISTMGNEFFFLHSIKDGSKKIAEIHFSKQYRLLYNRKAIWGFIDSIRTIQEQKIASKYDKFVTLTHEDATNWKELTNLAVIPNFITINNNIKQDFTYHRFICVGRLTYQKGYDRLIEACSLIRSELNGGWKIDIFGSGELEETIKKLVIDAGLDNIIEIHPPTKDIEKQYLLSDGILFTSRFEGLSMVLLEAMGCGVPAISFETPCGPKDIITDGKDGILVPNNNVHLFADAILRFINDDRLRQSMSLKAREKASMFDKKTIMSRWELLFSSIIKQK